MTARISQLHAELRRDSSAVATATPRLTWTVDTDSPGWRQDLVEIRDGHDIHRITTPESVLVSWPFTPLQAAETRTVQVKVQATSGEETDWSDPIEIYGAFLGERAWQARPIGHPDPAHPARPILLRRSLRLEHPIKHARLLWTAFGALDVEINGAAIDDSVLAPGWTSYHDRLIHETTDVTALLTDGENVIGLSLAGAWYTEAYGFQGMAHRVYGDQPAALAQLEIYYTDGTTETIATDDAWLVTDAGPILASGIYAGETYDASRTINGWSRPGFDPTGWVPAAVSTTHAPTPEARIAEPVRRIEERAVAQVISTPSGALVLDFEQNVVGWLKITVTGPAGHEITFRHAEVLEDGELGIRPLRFAAATDHYRLSGAGQETWEPQFTYHGFRYAQIDGWPGDFDPTQVTAVVVHSDMRRTGWFDSSHAELNRLHENVVWGLKGNFFSIPTDCPQRDERLGWTGDIQVFSPTASFLYDCHGFLVSWLRNLAVDQQRQNGVVPLVSPDVLSGDTLPTAPTAVWGDAATIVPWVLYQRFGDLDVLRNQYPSMTSWVDTVLAETDDIGLWAGKMQLGDWLDPAAPPDKPAKAKADPDIVATAYLAYSLRIVAATATLLGLHDDADRYQRHADRVTAAYLDTFVTARGRMMSDAATAYAITLEFNLITDQARRTQLAERLADVVRTNGYRISTGFVGTPVVTSALAANGQPYAAERLLLETSTPSWLSTVRKGATTIWERWDSMLDDGTINPGEMTSFNHYALGAVADWVHRSVAGLAPDAPGYRRLRISPNPLQTLDWAAARHDTPYGAAEVGWRRDRNTVTVTATVPANTTATVVLPGHEEVDIPAGTHVWTYDEQPAEHPPLTIDSPAADIIDDEPALRAVIAAVRRYDPDRADLLQNRAEWPTGGTLRWALAFAPEELIAEVSRALLASGQLRRG